LMLCGAAINLSKADIQPADIAMIWAAQNLMPTFAGVLLMAGIMAAALSSATTFLSLVGFSASNDVVRHALQDEHKLLRISRLCMLGIGVLVLILAFALPPRIFWITYFAGTVFASSWGPVAFMSVWSRTITADAAFWGIIVGFGGNIVTKALSYFGVIALPVWADPIILGAALSTVTVVLVSRRGTVSKEEQQNWLKLHMIPESERDANEIRRTLRWPVVLIVGGFLLSSLMIVFWVVPYQAAVHAGTLLGGELWVSIGCGLVLVASGLTVRRYVRNP